MRIVIVGAGSLGARTARMLVRRGCEVVIIEANAQVAETLAEALDCGVIHGDGTRPAVLTDADPTHSAALLTLTSNAQTNLIASLVGRTVGFSRVITRIDEEEFENVAIELGLTDTIVPARTIGRYLADVVEGQGIPELSLAIKGDARIFLFVARKEDEGPVSALGLPEGAHVSHLYRGSELIVGAGDPRVRKGDEVVIITHRRHLEGLSERWSPATGEPVS